MNSQKKRKFNTKKGISLVVAIALSAVLVLTTTTFISLALLQQKETGSELNTRQAYVSAKSALDMAKEMIQEGKIDLVGTGPFYYVLYHSGTGIGVQKCVDADSAKQFIKESGYTIIGNSYIKITKDGTNCTVSAFSSESKYTADPNDASIGDLSMKFDATETIPAKGTPITLKVNEGSVDTDDPPGSAPSSDRFLLIGGQTNFSLLKSGYKLLNNDDKNLLQLLAQYHISDGQVVFTPSVETDNGNAPMASQFPLVYTEVVKNNTSNYRSQFKVYDDGIYFLGCYNGTEIGTGNQYSAPNNVDASYFSNNNAYGSAMHCKFIVIEHNMLAKVNLNDANQDCAVEVRPYGTGDLDGIVVFLPNGSKFARYDTNGNQIDCTTYAKGYYWLPCDQKSEEVDLLAPNNGMQLICTLEEFDDSTDNRLTEFKEKSIYNTLKIKDSNSFRELHSAWESVSDNTTIAPVNILNSDGKFNTKDSKTYGGNKRASDKYYDAWGNYSIYCGPFTTPEATGYYDMYCGDTFNYLWYNVYDMNVKDGVKMAISSNNTVLTIGGDPTFDERVYRTSLPCGNIMRTYMPGENPPADETINKGPLKASRVVKGTGSAEFIIKPYVGKSTFTLTVMNDFYVDYPGYVKKNADDKGYLIKAGVYDDIYKLKKDDNTLLFKDGINLFTKDAELYFTNKADDDDDVYIQPSDDTSIAWVSDGKIANLSSGDPRLTQTDKYVNFVASSGDLSTSAIYSAKAIDCQFSHSLETNGATLKADLVSIKASKIKGNALYINTKAGSGTDSKKSYCEITNTETGAVTSRNSGHLLELKNDLDLVDNTGLVWRTMKKGFYFFDTSNESVNILDKNLWTSGSMPIYYAENKGAVTPHGIEFGKDLPETKITFNQGGYY